MTVILTYVTFHFISHVDSLQAVTSKIKFQIIQQGSFNPSENRNINV